MEPLADEYRAKGFEFVFFYTREAHPGQRFPHHDSLEQKLTHARAMVREHKLRRAMLVDDLEGTLHQAYGGLPNMTYIVDRRGRILFRSNWTDAYTIKVALDYLLHERQERSQRIRTAPFYAELLGHRFLDRTAFMEGLLFAGPRAVEEFIAATEAQLGEKGAQPLKDWWKDRKDKQGG